ncbi:MAG TPA: RdgB/HAM1 family non-canonical purine NTP pyrophosphatase [Methanolinea sp.]|nr:MAG: Non-canonical purine NTP pyrophosphatase [Methanoregulaceae archaeon PtaB.Bin009]HII76133.1 RdgB/HAM1 family non-canonical purine NTP pyrophosphatase [Methanolinea sp.]
MKFAVVTGNHHKAREIAQFFAGVAEVEHIPLECPETRDDDVGVISAKKAEYAYGILQRPLMTDDTSFCIPALGGFPGPYAAYVQKTIGNRGIIRLMEDETDRSAYFETAVAFADEQGISVFRGRIHGRIVSPRGEEGFGYDPVFEWEGRTLAEISLEEKSRVSHRARALANLRDWLEGRERERSHLPG